MIVKTMDFLLRTKLGWGVLALALVATGLLIWLGWWLGSPLFLNRTVDDAFPGTVDNALPDIVDNALPDTVDNSFPRTVDATIPSDRTREEIEAIMERAEAESNEVNHEVPAAMSIDGGVPLPLKTGSFFGTDFFHKGSGTATIFNLDDGIDLLRLENFMVTNGPKLHVYLSAHPNPMSSTETRQDGFYDLGELRANIGNQNYEIPSEVDLSLYNSVVIYCQPFHVLFSVASLSDAPGLAR